MFGWNNGGKTNSIDAYVRNSMEIQEQYASEGRMLEVLTEDRLRELGTIALGENSRIPSPHFFIPMPKRK